MKQIVDSIEKKEGSNVTERLVEENGIEKIILDNYKLFQEYSYEDTSGIVFCVKECPKQMRYHNDDLFCTSKNPNK